MGGAAIKTGVCVWRQKHVQRGGKVCIGGKSERLLSIGGVKKARRGTHRAEG